jgi:hypothetical protein
MAQAFNSSNCNPSGPCSCIQKTTWPGPAPCPSGQEDCCLKACNAILECTDAVGPCGAAGSFDLTTLSHIVTGCDGTIQYALESQDGFFSDVRITKAGILTWVTGGPETVGKYGTIWFRMNCQSDCDDCISLNAIGYIDVGVNDLCRNVICDEECEVCDPCSGLCVEQDVDLKIESVEN